MTAQLVFKSYKPLKLEKGMLFLTHNGYEGKIHQLDVIPRDAEEYVQINGYPVEPYIVDEGNPNLNNGEILATPEQIGWFDEGEWSDEICDIEIKHYNTILQKYDGWIELDLDAYEGKVIISYPEDIDDEWEEDDDDDDDEPDDDQIYNNFNHEGGIKY